MPMKTMNTIIETPEILEPPSGEVSHCVQVSERESEYESWVETQNSLLNLGKALAIRERDQQSKEEKTAYLLAAIKELDLFDGTVFMTEYEKSKDKNLRTAKAHSLARYISIFRELYNSTILDLAGSRCKISELMTEVAYQNEQLEGYIIQLDDTEESLSVKINDLIKSREETKTVRSELSLAKHTNSLYKAIIWSLVFILFGWVFSFYRI